VSYYLLRPPWTLKLLERELQCAAEVGQLSTPYFSLAKGQVLPYLDAVIKKALRIHLAVGLPLERVVPPSGAIISGMKYPGGTAVGVNAGVLYREYDIFVKDADDWRPERWLDSSAETKKNMDRAMFAFGGGSRTSIGKNISLLEVYKLVPTLLRHSEFELVGPEKEWTLYNAFSVH
jgi:cytochrome P450